MHHNPTELGAVHTEKENTVPAPRAGNLTGSSERRERPREEADSIVSRRQALVSASPPKSLTPSRYPEVR